MGRDGVMLAWRLGALLHCCIAALQLVARPVLIIILK
jgi:hypothetical protein